MRLLAFSVVVLAIVTDCTTLSRRQTLPPAKQAALIFPAKTERELQASQKYLDDLIRENDEQATRWWATYSSGLLWKTHDPLRACGSFSEAASHPDFPLAILASLRAMETCPTKPETLSQLWDFAFNDHFAWLKRPAVEIGLQKSKESGDVVRMVSLLVEKSKWQERQSEKLETLRSALTLAQNRGLEEQTKMLNERITMIAPRLTRNPTLSQWPAVAHDYRRTRDFPNAIGYYRKILKQKDLSPFDHIDILKDVRQTYKLSGDRATYVAVTKEIWTYTKKLLKKSPKNRTFMSLYHDAGITLTRTLWTESMLPEARKTLEILSSKLKGQYPLTEIYWMLARMSEEKQDYENTLIWSDLALGEAKPSSAIWESILWQKAWNSRKSGDLGRALTYFQQLRDAETSNKSRYAFWHARTLKESGDTVRAHVDLENLAKNDPLSWYGILAQRELGRPFDALKLSGADEPDVPSFFSAPEGATIRWLISVGETEAAKDFLRSMRGRTKSPSTDDQKAMATLFAAAGDYQGLLDSVNSWASEERKSLLEMSPELLFPRPYFQSVADSALRHSVPPELVYSIMRQESAFNPLARSPADAFGLMQLTPETARSIAGAVSSQKVRSIAASLTADDLYQPDVNIPLGTAQLRHTLHKFDNQMILAIASYNASEVAVQGWVKTRFRKDPVEFIEDIPYAETTMYVKLVLRNFVYYQRLNSKGAPVSFPEWTLAGLDTFKPH